MNKFALLLVLVISFFSVRPLFISGYFPMHDDTQPSRVYEMAKELKAGQFPVRWVPDLGYGRGYPIFNFYAPLPYYIGAIFNLLGFNIIDSTKIMMTIGMLGAAVTMYYLGKQIGGNLIGIITAVLYQYAPYHAVDLYVRGAVGELYAYAFIPLVLLGILLISRRKYFSGFIINTLGIYLTLISHNILGMILLYYYSFFLVLVSLSFFIFKTPKKILLMNLFSFLLAICMSAFFILPAFFEKEFTKVSALVGGGNSYIQHFVYPTQLWDSTWGYGGSAPGLEDGMSYKIGKTHIVLFVISIFVYFWQDKKNRKNIYLGLVFLLLSAFFTLDASSALWKILPGFPFIQYPWRFIALILLFLVFCTSVALSFFDRTISVIVGILTCCLLLVLNLKYFQPQYIYPVSEEKYISQKALTWDISRISDEYMPGSFHAPSSYEEVVSQQTNASIEMFAGQRKNSPVRSFSNIISLLSTGLFILLFKKKNKYFEA